MRHKPMPGWQTHGKSFYRDIGYVRYRVRRAEPYSRDWVLHIRGVGTGVRYSSAEQAMLAADNLITLMDLPPKQK